MSAYRQPGKAQGPAEETWHVEPFAGERTTVCRMCGLKMAERARLCRGIAYRWWFRRYQACPTRAHFHRYCLTCQTETSLEATGVDPNGGDWT